MERVTSPPPLKRAGTQAALETFLARLIMPNGGVAAAAAGGAGAGKGKGGDDFLGPLDEDVLLFSTLLLESILEHSSFAGSNDPGASATPTGPTGQALSP